MAITVGGSEGGQALEDGQGGQGGHVREVWPPSKMLATFEGGQQKPLFYRRWPKTLSQGGLATFGHDGSGPGGQAAIGGQERWEIFSGRKFLRLHALE
jgi:hypothetical protein